MPRPAPARRRWRKLIPVATAASTLCLTVSVGAALGQSGGVEPGAGGGSGGGGGGGAAGGGGGGGEGGKIFGPSRAQATPHNPSRSARRKPTVTYTFDELEP